MAHVMTIANIATAIIAFVALLGAIVAVMSWFFRRGADERELARAVRDNSEATRELSARLEAFMARYEERHEALSERVTEHSNRLGVAEERIRANTTDIARLWPSPGVAKPRGELTSQRE